MRVIGDRRITVAEHSAQRSGLRIGFIVDKIRRPKKT
jgi:hypothetical protein